MEQLIVAGTSLGGGSAASTARLVRDRGNLSLRHQILMCPILNDRFGTHSSRIEGMNGEDLLFGWRALLGDAQRGEDVSPNAARARAPDLDCLPRTYTNCGSAETFRDEVFDYAQRLSEAAVTVALHMWGGGFHGFDQLVQHAALSQASRATRDEFIARALEE